MTPNVQLPRPESYQDWRQWAAALLVALVQTTPPTVTGAKAGNVALTNLLKALTESGLVDDQTT
jgi:hypothetical protein